MKIKANLKFDPLFFFVKNQKFTSFLSIVLTAAFLNLLVGCSYYNVRDITTTPETMAQEIKEFNDIQNYAVIHSGETTWHLKSLVLNEDDKTITGTAQNLSAPHVPLKPRNSKRTHRYSKEQSPFNEIHFYVNTTQPPAFGTQVTIPFEDVTSISVNDKNNGRMVVNIALGTVGVIMGIFIIVLATKSSCPFIYIKSGDTYVFTGELYPGIITANQQRDDYLPIPNFEIENGEYSIKITNELKEIQHTDLVQLIIADHPANTHVLLDKNGIPHTFSNILSPENVLINGREIDKTPALLKDTNSYFFDSETDIRTSTRNIELKFHKPASSGKAKLLLTAKNTMWLDYVFGKFNEKFGSYYSEFQKNQQAATFEESRKWVEEQNIPLAVYLKSKNGWQLIEKINTVGPMAARDIAIPIDVSNISEDEIQIKLETGFMFWEVDFAGIDYSENQPLQMKYVSPSVAIDGTNNKEVTKLLAEIDQQYFVQPNIGDEVIVTFKADEAPPNTKRTIFLKNRGYYNYLRDYQGEPDFEKLKLFRTAGTFTDFSKMEYDALMDYEHRLDLVLHSK